MLKNAIATTSTYLEPALARSAHISKHLRACSTIVERQAEENSET